MTAEHLVFLRDERLPTVAQWQAALDDVDSGVALGVMRDLRKHVGRWPATHRRRDAPLEWAYGPVAEHFGGPLPEGVEDRTHAANFVTHGDLIDLVCALLAAAVLAQLADGVVFDPHSGGVVSGDVALRSAFDAERRLREDR